MATYAIGDVHGCLATLQALVERLPFDPAEDELWMVGDLVNRGPDSLGVLRWARERGKALGDRFRLVLGNHDLHLVATACGWRTLGAKDTFVDVLEAPDRDALVEWLRLQPLLVRRDATVLVHAGLQPEWSLDAAEEAARAVEAQIAGEGAEALLDRRGAGADSDEAAALVAFTRTRMLDAEGRPANFTGPPMDAPPGLRAWFDVPGRRNLGTTVVCGHWAALGLRLEQGLVAIDTGCAWGGALTAIRLEDREVFSEPSHETTRLPGS